MRSHDARTSGVRARVGRILVVDDEPHIVSVLQMILADDHQVVALTDPIEALDRLARDESYDVVMCDLVMPVVTGMDLYNYLRVSRSSEAERVVFLTGGALIPSLRAFLASVDNAVIEKPFAIDDVRRVVGARLRASHASKLLAR